jgi:hypothetical protein
MDLDPEGDDPVLADAEGESPGTDAGDGAGGASTAEGTGAAQATTAATNGIPREEREPAGTRGRSR